MEDAVNPDGFIFLLNAAAERGATEDELRALGADLLAGETELLITRAA